MSTICHVLLGQQVFSNWSGKTNRAALQPVQVLLPVSPNDPDAAIARGSDFHRSVGVSLKGEGLYSLNLSNSIFIYPYCI